MTVKRFLTVISRFCLVPVTTGPAYISANGQRKQDGSVSSVVIGVSLCAIVFVLLIITHTLDNLTREQVYGIHNFTHSILLIFGVTSLLVILRNVSLHADEDQTTNQHLWDAKHFKVIFLWLFAIGYLVETTLYILVTISDIERDQSGYLWIVRLVWNILLVIFLIEQTLLFTISKKYNIIAGIRLRYGLTLTILCNASLWFHAVLGESRSFHVPVNETHNEGKENIFEKWIHYLDPFIAPMTVEYTLLSLSFICPLMKLNGNSTARNLKDGNNDTQDLYDEIGEQFSEMDPFISTSNPYRCKKVLLPLVTGIFLIVPFLALEIYISVRKDIAVSDPLYAAYEFCLLVNHCVNVLLNFAGLCILAMEETSSRSTRESFGNENIILVFCCLIVQMIHVFAVFGNAMNKSHLVRHVVTIHYSVTFVGTMLQTMLIIQSKYQLSNIQRKLNFLKNVLLVTSMINFAIWISDSFLLKHTRNLMLPESRYYGDSYWNVIVDVLLPVGIFYRFHSALECFKLYTKLWWVLKGSILHLVKCLVFITWIKCVRNIFLNRFVMTNCVGQLDVTCKKVKLSACVFLKLVWTHTYNGMRLAFSPITLDPWIGKPQPWLLGNDIWYTNITLHFVILASQLE